MLKDVPNINELKENIAHGTPLFPFSIHNTQVSRGSSNILYKHWHQELEFLIVVEGGAIFYVGDDCYEVREQEGIFVPPNTLHYATSFQGLSCTFYAFVFHPNFLSDNYQSSFFLNYIKPVLSGNLVFTKYFGDQKMWHRDCISILLSLSNLYNTSLQDYELLIKGRMYELWHLFIKHATNLIEPLAAKPVTSLEPALNYIHTHYKEDILLKTLSDCVTLSESRFCRSFKSAYGLSPFSYLIRYRILKSCEMITDTNDKIANIACHVGFNNISYFNRTFKSMIGCTPIEYRLNKDTYITHNDY